MPFLQVEKNMRPIIGLIPLYDDDKDSYWMLPGYMKAIEKCGGLPVMLPLTDDKAELDDGLVEAIEIKNHRFAIAVQWHPEFSYEVSKDSISLIQAFVDACNKD